MLFFSHCVLLLSPPIRGKSFSRHVFFQQKQNGFNSKTTKLRQWLIHKVIFFYYWRDSNDMIGGFQPDGDNDVRWFPDGIELQILYY
jgi:hypothetical protein